VQIRPTVSFYHDCRRPLANGKYPVKIRVTFQVQRLGKDDYVPKYPKTGVSLSPEEFTAVLSSKVPARLQKTRQILLDREKAVNKILDDHPGIGPDLFESLEKGKVVSRAGRSAGGTFPITLDVGRLFDHLIKEYEANGQIGTRDSYRDARNSLMAYGGHGLTLDKIDRRWLEGYEKWAQVPRKFAKNKTAKACSLTTIAIYLRCLRHVFNEAIDLSRRILPADKYPFKGKDGYTIRSQESAKQVVDNTQKQKIFTDGGEAAEERKAMKYWMFWYYCHGMNAMDAAFLRPENVRENEIVYVRRKTMRTVKVVKPQIVPIRPEVRAILDELGTHKPYVFGIITDDMTPEEQNKRVEYWYKWVNKYMARIAARAGIPFKVTSYGARHAVGKQLIEKGAHLQYIQELYGHRSIKTTQVYTSGMNIEKTKELTDLL
jgi:integrase/recombinase XerD